MVIVGLLSDITEAIRNGEDCVIKVCSSCRRHEVMNERSELCVGCLDLYFD